MTNVDRFLMNWNHRSDIFTYLDLRKLIELSNQPWALYEGVDQFTEQKLILIFGEKEFKPSNLRRVDDYNKIQYVKKIIAAYEALTKEEKQHLIQTI